jgi:hypothetical protein
MRDLVELFKRSRPVDIGKNVNMVSIAALLAAL